MKRSIEKSPFTQYFPEMNLHSIILTTLILIMYHALENCHTICHSVRGNTPLQMHDHVTEKKYFILLIPKNMLLYCVLRLTGQ